MFFDIEVYGKTISVEQKDNGKFVIPKEINNFSGWKSFSLKPSVECVVVVQKPKLEKTIVGQVLQNGCGAVNVQACRIPYASASDIDGRIGKEVSYGLRKEKGCFGQINDTKICGSTTGRFPANLLCEGEPLIGEEKKGNGHFNSVVNMKGHTLYEGGFKDFKQTDVKLNDSGTANRFYSLDAWALKRNITLTEDSAFFDVPKPSKAEKNLGCEMMNKKFTKTMNDGIGARPHNEIERTAYNKNNHPTTKPVKLFCYLSKLFCQPKGVILDPFLGSGTTGVACAKMGFDFIGIEKEVEYFQIAKARIENEKKQTRLF